ncbi:MAG: GTPase Era, partial [Betaproteobacteria bacterium]|nr:GTPase Era [Betaproteobacteria bacterium]
MQDKQQRCGRVAIMGPPNAGKSTLLNALLGQKVSIVTPRAQTTRNQIVGIFSEPGMQVIFMDTPGLTKARGRLPKMMLQSVWQSMDTADVLLLILDCSLYLRKPEFLERDTETLAGTLAADGRPLIVLVNKVDTFADKSRMLPLLERLQAMWPKAEIFPASALLRDGLPELMEIIKKNLPIGPAQFPEEQLSTASVRFMAAEIIR